MAKATSTKKRTTKTKSSKASTIKKVGRNKTKKSMEIDLIDKDLIQNPENCGSHVVLLGAGASRAAFPNGDMMGKFLPLMSDIVNIIPGMEELLKNARINPNGNFEVIYSNLKNRKIKKSIEKLINSYFSALRLPSTATHYDRLLLSLRKKDAIFTFNWDPFLFDAYKRNYGIVTLPEIFFLHGNVRIGSCAEHLDKWGMKDTLCPLCNEKFSDIPLLYPIKKKNYFESHEYIKGSWENAKYWFSKAFTITIFGYSAPITDIEAKNIINTAWLSQSERKLENIEIINTDTTYDRWKNFTPSNYIKLISLEKSSLWNWPRRTCEAIYYSKTEGKIFQHFPLPVTDNLLEIQKSVREIEKYE